jgi:hypothetical protein
MKEQIHLVLTDLDNCNHTLMQLALAIEKITTYYVNNDIDNLTYFIENNLLYFYILNQAIQTAKGEEDEN